MANRIRKPKVPKQKKSKYGCRGGPYHGKAIWLSGVGWNGAGPSTLFFKLNGEYGRYIYKGTQGVVQWEPAPKPRMKLIWKDGQLEMPL